MTIIEALQSSKNVLIVGHQRPDGDCIGSGLALCRVCDIMGKSADFLCDSDNPAQYAFMPGFERLNDKRFKDYDLLITVDCADIYRMGKYNGYLKSVQNTFNIDHHKTNNKYAKHNIVLPLSSTCEIIYGLLKDTRIIDETVASLLFVGLSTDTGHFMHSNTTAEVFKAASDLVSLGANPYALATSIYKTDTVNKIKLTAKAIESMRFFCNNKICVITVRQEDLQSTKCCMADTEGLIDYAMKIGCVEVGICLTEQMRPHFKVSFRSKKIDVAAAAATFGGGGHTLAAGCVVSGKYEDVVDKLLKAVTDGMPV